MDQVQKQLVESLLDKILNTPPFKKSRILSKFLRYSVQASLENKKGFLKEYVIGLDVLNRDADFDPQHDPIVRVHASRLRTYLNNYYRSQGINDPIRLTIPLGTYSTLFEKNVKQTASNASPAKDQDHSKQTPRIAVLSQQKFSSDERLKIICSSLSRDLTIALSKFKELDVISYYNTESAYADQGSSGISDIISQFSLDYLIVSSCWIEETCFKVSFVLHSTEKKLIIWSDSYTVEDYTASKIPNYQDIIYQTISRICGFLGVIYSDTLSNRDNIIDYAYLYAIYWHNKFHLHYSRKSLGDAFSAVKKGLEKNPDNSLLNALKAELLLNSRAMDVDCSSETLKRGFNYVSKAIKLDQTNQHAWEMMAWACILKFDRDKSIQAIEKCYSINPGNTMYEGSLGFGYVCVGLYERGLVLLLRSIQAPYYFWVANIGLCLYYLYEQNFEEALYWALLMERHDFVWDPLLRLCCYGHLGNGKEIKASHTELLKLSPGFKGRARNIIRTFLHDPELHSVIENGLQKAGAM